MAVKLLFKVWSKSDLLALRTRMNGIHFEVMKTNKGVKILKAKDHTEKAVFFRPQENIEEMNSPS